jgi:hypothetical protein
LVAEVTAAPVASLALIRNEAVGSATQFSLHEGQTQLVLDDAHVGYFGRGFVEPERDVEQVR